MLGGSVAVSLLLLAGSAFAQGLDKDQQKCIDGYNNKLRLVSQQAGKSARKCVKDAAKAGTDPDTCIVTNTDGKVAGKQSKVTDLYTSGKCTGTEPIQQGAATGNAAHEDGIYDFVHEILGDPVGVLPTNKDDGKCLDKGVQRSTQAITEIIKAHRKCKKDAMKAGTVTDSTSLAATCGTFAQIDGGGKAAAKLTKLDGDVTATCATTTTALSALFDGLDAGCTATAAALGDCLVAESRCAACLILEEADGATNMDCDVFDDNAANGSCGFVPLNVGSHSCTLDAEPLLCVGGPFNGLPCTVSADCVPGFCATAASKLDLRLTATAFELPASGTVDINCGSTDPSGKATCTCDVDAFDPIVIPSIGTVCIDPVGGCPSGEIDCDGGNSLNVDTHADHNIGACASNAACDTACDSFCDTLGPTYDAINSGCEGRCDGGSNDEMACSEDTDCPGGSCPGLDPVTHSGVCGCTCAGTGLGGASVPGGLSCNLGVQIDVVIGGTCADPPSITLNPLCGPLSTETATSRVFDANNAGGTFIPAPAALTQTGTAIDCNTLATSTTTGLRLVGGLGFFDSTLGDILSGQVLVCQ